MYITLMSRFLDDYYAQFEARTEKAQAAKDMMGAESSVGTPR